MKGLNYFSKWLGLIMFPVIASTSFAEDIVPFTSSSFESIKAEYTGKEFLVGLWSVDCPPCLVELKLMSNLLSLNPDLPFVLISTDSIELKEEAAEFLDDFNLADRKTWMFADNFVEKLRYTIDPNWYGELPRSYFFSSDHTAQSHSGILTEDILKSWFANRINY